MDSATQARRPPCSPWALCSEGTRGPLGFSLCPRPKPRACDATVRCILLMHSRVHTRIPYAYTPGCARPNTYTQAPCRHTRGHVLSDTRVPVNTPTFPDIFKFPPSTHTEIHMCSQMYTHPLMLTHRTHTHRRAHRSPHADTHTYPWIYRFTHRHTHTQTYTHSSASIQSYVFIATHTCADIHTHAHAHTYMHTHTHTHTHNLLCPELLNKFESLGTSELSPLTSHEANHTPPSPTGRPHPAALL